MAKDFMCESAEFNGPRCAKQCASCAPRSDVAITHAVLGHIPRWSAERGNYVADDEALIFLNNDNEQTCHVEGPNARAMAAQIVAAVNAALAAAKSEPR